MEKTKLICANLSLGAFEKHVTWFLQNADIVRWTRRSWTKGIIFRKKIAGDDDPQFKSAFEGLQVDFLRKVKNNQEYGEDETSQSNEHYFFRLSPRMKKKIKEELLQWNSTLHLPTFYGFEDPAFYKGDKILGYIISHEGMVFVRDPLTFQKR